VVSDFWSKAFTIRSAPTTPEQNPIRYVGATTYSTWETVSIIAVILDDGYLPITGLSPTELQERRA